MSKSKVLILTVVLYTLILASLYSAETPMSTVPVRFSFDMQTAVSIEFGFTRNTVADMGTNITQINFINLIEEESNSRIFTLPYEVFAYWRLLAASDYTLSLKHTGYLDDSYTTDPTQIIPFTLVCGTETIPADTDTVIFSHTGSITPTVQSKPIVVQASSDRLNASYYVATLTLTLTAI